MRQSRDQKLKTPVGVAAVVAVVGVALVVAGDRVGEAAVAVQSDDPYVPQAMMGQPVGPAEAVEFTAAEARGVEGNDVPEVSDEALTQVVRRVCVSCHNDALRTADLSLQDYAVDKAPERPETTEKMIEKLRLGMMPPPGIPYPAADTMTALVETLERKIDESVAADPNPGTRPFQRLNRIEYERAIHDLLGLEINAGEFLPQDTRMASFDNIADAQLLSAALVDSYMAAAAEVSRMALGAPEAGPTNTTYLRSGYASQWDRVEGAPFGTRGGISVTHNFPADGEYRFRMTFENTTTGGHVGSTIQNEDLEISIDGEPRAVMKVDQWMHSSDPHAVQMESEPLFIEAGPKRVSVAFINLYDGPVEDLPSPHDWSLADRRIGAGGYGITQFTHLKDVTINGPHNVTGVSEHPVRERVFTCRPSSEAEEEACAAQILEELAERAYRRPVQDHELADLMSFYELGYADGGFDIGVRTGLQAILASPDFIFRLERPADEAEVEEGIYRISDWALASRLSFFLWGSPPDEELREVAREGELSDPDVLEEQTRRMLQDERAEALATRFASQWFRLHDLEHLNPDAFWYPDYDQQLAHAMRQETQQLFWHLVREDRSPLELIDADYTFVNERLAKHYGMPDVTGSHFRRVEVADERRHGVLGHASVLAITSHANRTSPVNRGLWVMEVLLGTEPPPPPPVPALDQTAASEDGEFLTTRQRLAMHRADPTCNSCHQFIDPMGVALENFDVTGKWRTREDGRPLDSSDELWDGTLLEGPADLRAAILERRESVLRNFTENMMAYALGRRVEYFDMPTVRQIVREAQEDDYRMSNFILGVVTSDQFQKQRPGEVVAGAGAAAGDEGDDR